MNGVDLPGVTGCVLEDREQGIFRVHHRAYTDAAILVREQEKIFAKTWLYVGHETEIPLPGDFRTRRVAGRPVIMIRGSDGQVRVLFNTCRHRGALVCRERQGNTEAFQCFYHAYTYNNRGDLIGVPGEDAYGPAFKKSELGLMTPAQVDSYRGFVFMSRNPSAPSLAQYLGPAREYLDLAVDQGEPDGIEIVGGTHDYSMHGNWKLLVENSIDNYHVIVTHYRYFNQYLPAKTDSRHEVRRPTAVGSFSRDLGNGHVLMDYPLGEYRFDEPKRQRWEQMFGRERATQMIDRNHNLFIFPNLVLINGWRMVRTFAPISPSEVEVSSWALLPKGENAEIRRARLDSFVSFLGPAGFGTPDDGEGLESVQRGIANTEVEWSDISRGMLRPNPIVSDELQIQTFWRHWERMMSAQ